MRTNGKKTQRTIFFISFLRLEEKRMMKVSELRMEREKKTNQRRAQTKKKNTHTVPDVATEQSTKTFIERKNLARNTTALNIVCLCTRRTDSKNHDITIAENKGILVMYLDALVERSVFIVAHFGFMHLFNFSCVNLRSR